MIIRSPPLYGTTSMHMIECPMTDFLQISDTPFHNLMANRIRDILLICSKYDRFMLEEDGRIEELLFQDYIALGLTSPPKITHAPSAQKALKMMETRNFDMVITMVNVGNVDVMDLARTIKQQFPEKPVIVLTPAAAYQPIRRLKQEGSSLLNYIFAWQGNPNILLAIVKLIEDRMNVDNDIRIADVQTIILVEDSIAYYSTYLPMIYTTLIQQARGLMTEGLNEWSQAQRMRGRPKILLARNYEEAVSLYETYHDSLLGIISDVSYRREGSVDPLAGIRFCRHVRQRDNDIPLLLQSTEEQHAAQAKIFHAAFIHKHSKTLLLELRDYIRTNYGFGDFIFHDPDTKAEVGRVSDLRELQYIIPELPSASFLYHVRNNDFSKWLKARALFPLAHLIRPKKIEDYPDEQSMRDDLVRIIETYRLQQGRGIIARFNKDSFDEYTFFSRIGSGSLGGKGRGLAFLDLQLKESSLSIDYPQMYINIPRTIVISTELFDLFMEENNLHAPAMGDRTDQEILDLFLGASLPEGLEENLRAILNVLTSPLAVRSSSLLEDSHYQPFAGIYQTCMIPNNHEDFEERLTDLSNAVKCVYASTYFQSSKDYLKATNHMIEEEKMAVVIQRITGNVYGSLCYPNFSGVARSLNYYPVENERPEDGIAYIAFGFGKTVVDDLGTSLRFSPRYPKKIMQLSEMQSTLKNTQQHFHALDMNSRFNPFAGNTDNLVQMPVEEAAGDGSMKYIASTYDEENFIVRDTASGEGRKIISFAGLLKYNLLPISSIICDLLKLGENILNVPIEIEFAGNLDKSPKVPEFSLLQIRPIVAGYESGDVKIDDSSIEQALIYSPKAMGNGKFDDLRDVVYVKPDRFDPSRTKEMAQTIGLINEQMMEHREGFILIAAGRLGSSDPWLGIPITWSQISFARVIIEMGLEHFQVEPSQGTHFFQNLTSLRNAYMTINPPRKQGTFRWELLDSLPAVHETEFIRHVRLPSSLDVRIDGKSGKGIILI